MAIDEKKLKKALNALQTFTENWCMDKEETEKQDDLVFRCEDCPFKNGKYCRIKEFGRKHNFALGCMSR